MKINSSDVIGPLTVTGPVSVINGTMRVGIINNGVGNFVTLDGNNVLTRRTASEVRSDIGAGIGNGTVTSVAALTLGTTGTDLTSTVANGTTTPVITLNVPTASAINRGVLSSADWTTFNNKQGAGNYITALTGEVTASGPGSVSATLLNSAVIGKVLTGLNLTGGGSIAATDTILQAFGKTQNQISALVGGVMYEGVWNASTNTPAITSSVGSKGDYYVVNVAGSTNINGITSWAVGDWIIFNGSVWDKVDNTDAVSSVNGQTGAVSLSTTNIAEGTNLYYTEARVNANTNVAANTAARHAAVTLGTANGLGLTGQQLSLGLASSSANGALSSTDWNTFNNKTSNTGTVTSVGGTGTVSGLTLSGTVTTSGNLTLGGTLSVTPSNFASQTANTILAAPNGAAGVPTFRALVAADVPTLNQNTTGTAAALTTARTINGTSFNGSADITTANWGTARTLTIGATGKSVNGSGNVAWTLGEIQAEYEVPLNTLRNNLGSPTVREAALFHGQFNNKFRFLVPTLQEESADGTTWVTSTRASAAVLGDMMIGEGQGTSFNAIPTGAIGTYGAYRLTWNVVGSTGYVFLNALYIFNSTNGNTVNITIEALHNTNGWQTITGPHATSNWPGHAYVPHSNIPYSNSSSQYSQVRITFTTTHNVNTNAFNIYSIEWFGGYPQGKRNVESYDRNRNVTFPAAVNSTSFIRLGGTSTQYLMADGSVSTLTNPVTGTIASGQVAFGTAANTVGGSNNLFWDNTNGRLGIGTTSPSARLQVNTSSAGANALQLGVTSQEQYVFETGISGITNGALVIRDSISPFTYITLRGGNVGIGNTSPANRLDVNGKILSSTEVQGGIAVMNSAGGYATFGSNSSAVGVRVGRDAALNDIIINPSGNVTIGSTTDAGFKLDVNGTGRFSGGTSNIPLQITSSSSNGTILGLINTNAGTNSWGINSYTNGILYFQYGTLGSGSNPFYVTSLGAATFSSSVTATSFVRSGGTAAQFLKANGTIDSSVYLTAESDTLASVTGRGATTTTLSNFNGGINMTGATSSTGLSINSSSASGGGSVIRITKTAAANQAYMTFDADQLFFGIPANNTTDADIGTKASVNLRFQTNYTTRINIGPTGTIRLVPLTSNGFLRTSGGDGTLTVDTTTYLTGNQTITLSGVVTGSGTTAITTAIANGAISNAMLANSSFFIGTTSIALGRASAAQTLAGVSIDGNAGTVGTFAETAFAVSQRGGDINANATLDSNTLRNGMYRVNSTVTSSPNSARFWALNVYGNQSNVVSQLASDFQTGETFVRGYNSAWSAWRRVWDSVNLTNLNQLTNGPGYITAETDTLASVTGRGATTSTPITVTASEGREVAVFLPASYTIDDLVSGHEYGWYSDHWRLGMTRSGAQPGADFVVQWNGARRLSLTNGGNLTVTGTISASNLSGTNTGDQTNISGNAATVDTLAALGSPISYNNDRTTKVSNGLAIYSAYLGGSNSPWTYDLAAQFVTGSRGFEFSASWTAPSQALKFRTLRDCCDNWSSWVDIITSSNFNSYAPTLAGVGATGTWNISISGNAGSVSGLTLNNSGSSINPDNVTQNQIGYNTSVSLFGQTDGGLYSSAFNSNWIHQIYGDFRTGQIAIRGKNSGTWQAWRTVIDSVSIGNQSVNYALNSTRLYASNAPYTFGGTAPYYMTMNYDGSRWLLEVTPGTPAAVRVAYADTAGSVGSVAWSNISSRPSNIMYYQGFTLDANTMDSNATGFSYAINAPYVGPIARFSTNGAYDLWLNATYIGGANLAFRTRNGDNGTLNPWRRVWSDADSTISASDDFRAPIFYDSNNTAYYLDPAASGTSLYMNGGITTTAPGGTVLMKHAVSEVDAWIFQENAANWGLYWKNAPSGHHTLGGYTTIGAELFGMSANNGSGNGVTTSNFVGATSAVAQWMLSNFTGYIWSASTVFAAGDMRAPIFYDSQNTGFYFDGAGTTNINALSGNGKEVMLTSDSYLRINQSSAFSSGTWFGGTLIRVDGFYAGSNGGTTSSRVAIQSGSFNGTNVINIDGSNGQITASSFFESSDATLKTLITDNYQAKAIDSVVAKLYIKNGKEELGYYAQELVDILPSAVSRTEDGLLNLSYREVHTAKIAFLEEKIKQLEKQLSSLL